MNNLQGSGQISNPIQYPNPNSNPNPNQKTLSFDQVSKFFNLPLSDAAESLGVCASVLKKTCYENGLVRWPSRQVLSGKSIEDIKEEALREKQENSVEFIKATSEKHDALAGSSISSSLVPQLQNKSTSSTMEVPRAGAFLQQQGTKNTLSGNSLHFRISNLTRGTLVNSDEFKYGFPSNGLSKVTHRWWGNKSADPDVDSDNASPAVTSLLTDVRKQAVKEGKEALRLGVYKGNNAKMLDSTKRKILLQVFKSYRQVNEDMSNLEP